MYGCRVRFCAHNGTPVYTTTDYQHALWIMPILYVVAGFLVYRKMKDSYGHM